MGELLWWLAWRPKAALVLGAVLGSLLGIAEGSPALGLAGFILPVALWFWSTQSVNERWARTLDAVRIFATLIIAVPLLQIANAQGQPAKPAGATTAEAMLPSKLTT